MGAYSFLGVTQDGRRVRGSESADSVEELRTRLDSRHVLLVKAEENAIDPDRPRAGSTDHLRELANLVEAGVPISRALREIERRASGPIAQLLRAVRGRVERGVALSGALGAVPGLATDFQIALISAGERAGDLPAALVRVADLAESERELRRSLLTIALYPATLAAVGGLSLIAMLLFVVPRFAALFEDTDIAIPWTTSTLLTISTLGARHGAELLLVCCAGLVTVASMSRTQPGRELLSSATLAMPVVGELRRTLLRARYSRLAATLVNGGAPIGSALREVATSLGDPIASREAGRIADRVREGDSLSAAMSASPLLAGSTARLVAIGEETGRLGPLLDASARAHEGELQRRIDRVTKLLEPAMTVAFGLIIGLIAVALLQAVYGINAGALR